MSDPKPLCRCDLCKSVDYQDDVVGCKRCGFDDMKPIAQPQPEPTSKGELRTRRVDQQNYEVEPPYTAAQLQEATRQAMERIEAVRQAGAVLSNCAFNLAQRNPGQFTARDIEALDSARKAWDDSLRALAAAKP